MLQTIIRGSFINYFIIGHFLEPLLLVPLSFSYCLQNCTNSVYMLFQKSWFGAAYLRKSKPLYSRRNRSSIRVNQSQETDSVGITISATSPNSHSPINLTDINQLPATTTTSTLTHEKDKSILSSPPKYGLICLRQAALNLEFRNHLYTAAHKHHHTLLIFSLEITQILCYLCRIFTVV